METSVKMALESKIKDLKAELSKLECELEEGKY